MTKILGLAICLLLVSTSFAAKTRLTSAQEKKVKELKESKLGHLIFELAELHIMSQGPLEDLIEALEALISDIDEKIEENDVQYNERSLQNQSEVTRLTGEITNAEVQISNTENLLNNILYPTLEELQGKVERLHEEVADNNEYVERITYEREEAHASYEQRVAEHNDALAALDECLEVLSELTGGASLSLIQTKRAKVTLNKAIKSLKRGVEQTMVKALIQMANSEFADSGALLRVVQAIEDVKEETLNAIELEHVNEATAVEQYESEVAQKESENQALGREINILNGEVEATENRIAEKENYLAIRQQDLANFTAELEAEEAAFEEATEFYENVRAELVREQAVGNDALQIVSNAGFGSSLSGNIAF